MEEKRRVRLFSRIAPLNHHKPHQLSLSKRTISILGKMLIQATVIETTTEMNSRMMDTIQKLKSHNGTKQLEELIVKTREWIIKSRDTISTPENFIIKIRIILVSKNLKMLRFSNHFANYSPI